MRAIIKSLSMPDFDAKPKIVARKDDAGRTVHDITNPEVLAPWQVIVTLESDGPMNRGEVNDLLDRFREGRAV